MSTTDHVIIFSSSMKWAPRICHYTYSPSWILSIGSAQRIRVRNSAWKTVACCFWSPPPFATLELSAHQISPLRSDSPFAFHISLLGMQTWKVLVKLKRFIVLSCPISRIDSALMSLGSLMCLVPKVHLFVVGSWPIAWATSAVIVNYRGSSQSMQPNTAVGIVFIAPIALLSTSI